MPSSKTDTWHRLPPEPDAILPVVEPDIELTSWFLLILSMDIVTRKQLNILIQLAEADKHFARPERDMIFQIAKERNFPEEEVLELIRKPEPIETLGALSPNTKFEYMMGCIRLVFADHKVFERELIFCKGIAIKLGFRKDVVEYLIENHSRMPENELKAQVFGVYLV